MKTLSVVATLTFALGAAGCATSDASPSGATTAQSVATTAAPSTTGEPSVAPAPETTAAPSSSDVEVAGALPTPDCLARFEDAAAVDEMQDTVEDLYPALEQCAGLDDWIAASGAVPEVLDGVDPTEFAFNACSYGGPAESITCVEAIAADPLGMNG